MSVYRTAIIAETPTTFTYLVTFTDLRRRVGA